VRRSEPATGYHRGACLLLDLHKCAHIQCVSHSRCKAMELESKVPRLPPDG
jgi:hypothetical protein